MEIALVSYALAALAFLALGVFLLATSGGHARRRWLGATCLASAAWAVAAFTPWLGVANWSLAAALLELLRSAGWSLFMLMLIGVVGPASGQRVRAPAWKLGVLLFYVVSLLATVSTSWRYGYPLASSAFMLITALRICAAVLGLFLVEQVYRNTVPQQRWGIKFACLGMGVMFAYDFYMYSDAMLLQRLSPDIWSARGLVNALAMPMIAVSSRRNPRWSLGLTVSRRVLFHSAALFGAAGYLLAMASAGYALRVFGGSWGQVMQLAFLFGAVMLLVGVLFSGGFRSWLRVFISKHFYRYNYDYRDEWLRFTRALSEKGPGLEERVVQALARLVESPAGAVFAVEEGGRCRTLARWNLPLDAEGDGANLPLLRFLEQKQWVLDLREYARAPGPGPYEGLVLPAWLATCHQAWLVVPLEVNGSLFGFVVLAHARSPLTLNWEVIDLLKVAASQAAASLAQQRVADDLMVARQFESFNRMSTFLVHDLKNLVSQLSLLMANAERHKDNPEFQRDMLDTVDYSVQKMKLLLHRLSRKDNAEHHAPVRLDELLARTVAAKSAAEPRPSLQVLHDGLVVLADQERLERVLGHIIQNAIEASPGQQGAVQVSVVRQGQQATISVRDNGRGMSAEFMRDRLFKPFETTKAAGMGIGLFESREYILALGGQLQLSSEETVGTEFRITLPLQAALA